METYFKTKLAVLIANSKLSEDEKIFLVDFSSGASDRNIQAICLKALESDDKADYFKSLIYGVKIKKHIAGLKHLEKEIMDKILQTTPPLFGWQKKQLYESIISGDIVSVSNEINVEKIENDLHFILENAQNSLSSLIIEKTESRDENALEKLRKKIEEVA